MLKIIKKSSLLIIILIISFSCINEKDRTNHLHTFQITDRVFLEKYSIFQGGVFGGSIESYYLTDSLTFIIFINSHDENEYNNYDFYNDTIIEYTHYKEHFDWKIIDSSRYPLDSLKALKNYR